ncbi:hypothetical protein VQ643_15160 [Pseudomonas sp. F1_0610]|uniref:hypothetical protein n=1 Tax=Pseudomonas sp. F1_0610 TaxID=3114284 RepID=UPI0039C2D602
MSKNSFLILMVVSTALVLTFLYKSDDGIAMEEPITGYEHYIKGSINGQKVSIPYGYLYTYSKKGQDWGGIQKLFSKGGKYFVMHVEMKDGKLLIYNKDNKNLFLNRVIPYEAILEYGSKGGITDHVEKLSEFSKNNYYIKKYGDYYFVDQRVGAPNKRRNNIIIFDKDVTSLVSLRDGSVEGITKGLLIIYYKGWFIRMFFSEKNFIEVSERSFTDVDIGNYISVQEEFKQFIDSIVEE